MRGSGLVLIAACATPMPPAAPPHVRDHALAVLDDIRPYRNYIAVTDVGPSNYHFVLWFHEIEPVMARIGVSLGADHQLVFEAEGGYAGGIGVPPRDLDGVPSNMEPLARRVEAEFQRRHPKASEWRISYVGHSRRVRVQELVAHDFRTGTHRAGWVAASTFGMDDSLSRILHGVESSSGFGSFEVPADAQWVDIPDVANGRELLLTKPSHALVAAIGEAARRFAANAPSPTLASLVPADAPMLPAGYVADVAARVHLWGHDPVHGTLFEHAFRIPLDLRHAVFGVGAIGDETFRAEGRRYTLRAALKPATALVPAKGHAHAEYAGTLDIRIEDDDDHVWQHAYRATGPLELEGDQVVAPTGFVIPGASGPSKEMDARHGKLAGNAGVELDVDVSVYAEPLR